MKPLPSLEFLMECFELDASCPSGLRWKERPLHHFESEQSFNIFKARFTGNPVGTPSTNNYWTVSFRGNKFATHRIVYAIFHKTRDLKGLQVDHIDNNRSNNSPENLRLVTHTENGRNTKMRSNNTSGLRGVVLVKKVKGPKRWIAQIIVGKKYIYLGSFETKEDAGRAYDAASERLHGIHGTTNKKLNGQSL